MEFNVCVWNLLAIAGPARAKVLILELQPVVLRADVVHHVLLNETLYYYHHHQRHHHHYHHHHHQL